MKAFTFSRALRIAGGIAAFAMVLASAPAQTTPPPLTVPSVPGQPIGPTPITDQTKTEVLGKINDLLTRHAYVPSVNFDEWPDFLKGEQDKLDNAKTNDEFARDLNMALSKFGTSHVFLATPRQTAMRKEQELVGIGIRQYPVPGGLEIVRLVPGAPAEEAGLVAGDIIIKVDGNKVEGVKGIPGPEGTKVVLTIKHKDGKIQDYTVERRKFSTVWPEELSEIDKDTCKLTINTFDWTYNRENVENLMGQAQKYKNLILDLRDNGGGAVVNLQHMLSMFIPKSESIGTFVNKEMVNSYVRDTHGSPSDVIKIAEWSRHQGDDWDFQQIKPLSKPSGVPLYTGHVAVLINRFSGSASEIAAAALHDLIGASIVGQKSAGAVLVSVIVPATNDFTLQYPIMDYVTIRGVRLEGTGITPEVEVALKGPVLPGEPDEAVEKAEALFARDKLREDRGIGV